MTLKATIVADLGFGDSGKGSIIDYLAREQKPSAIVRFNGGAQAAHNVIDPLGRHHTFAQFGSGTFVPGVQTHLSRFMLVDVPALQKEAEHLEAIGISDAFARLSVDEDAMIVTHYHKAINRLREVLRGTELHGSCGMGIGETMIDSITAPHLVIRAADLRDPRTLYAKLRELRERKIATSGDLINLEAVQHLLPDEVALLKDPDAPWLIAQLLTKIAQRFKIVSGHYLAKLGGEGDLLFEGAQGVLIDEWHGFHPYTTWSTTTFENALTLLREIGYQCPIERLGVLRAYHTRHGAGPIPTHDTTLSLQIPDHHNGTGRWQGNFRVGWFDMVLAKYAKAVCGQVDSLAITNLDRFARVPNRKLCVGYHVPKDMRLDPALCNTVASDDPRFLSISSLNAKTVLTDLGHQAALCALLQNVTPIYEDAPAEAQYLARIERELNVPITIASHGPTARDKGCLGTGANALAA